MTPLVTCLCLTKDRREWLPKAIECFLRQTYENRELLIVANRPEDCDGIVPPDPRIQVSIADGVVGKKRNAGCEEARGEVIAIWDDDDYSAPGRLAHQVAKLAQSAKAVTGFSSMKFTDGAQWWQYAGITSAIATSLCFANDWWSTHRFREIQCGQDEMFAALALGVGQLHQDPDLDLMYATVHKGNTSPRATSSRATFRSLPGFAWKDAA